MWTIALTVTGLAGLWLVASHWQGWILYLINEALWLVYGLTIRSTPVLVMSVLWFAIGVRNLFVTRRIENALRLASDLPEVQPDLRDDDGAGPVVASNVSVLHDYAERRTEFWRPY